MNYLLVDSGPHKGRQYELPEGDCVLGRHPECQVVIEVGAVSRHHAQIIHEPDGIFVEDLNSRNGTYLNGDIVRGRQRLRNGDQIRICDVAYSFHGEESDSGTDASSLVRLVVEDSGNSTIMSKLDVSSNRGGVTLTASAEAKLAALLEITQSLGRTVALDDVLPKLLESLFKIFMQADRGFVILRDDNGNLVPRWSKLRRENSDETLRISRTIVQEVIDSKQAVLSADAASDARFQMSESVADFRIRSMLCAPLLNSDGEALGVLQVDTLDQKKRFAQEDLEVLNSVATQAAVAIENATLHDDALTKRALERDLQLAREVQESFLPLSRPKLDEYDFYDYYRPANHVGGDFYDYVNLRDGRIAILVADIVGHGVAAALLMAKLAAEVRFSLSGAVEPAEAITQLNHRFSQLEINRFATLIVVALDPVTHEATVVNCGHMPPIVRKADGSIDEPGAEYSGIPVGINDDVVYKQFSFSIAPGETVTLYTDGINEAMDAESECFGVERVRRQIATGTGSLKESSQAILEQVRQHIGEGTQDDDMCLVCFGRRQAHGDESELKQTLDV